MIVPSKKLACYSTILPLILVLISLSSCAGNNQADQNGTSNQSNAVSSGGNSNAETSQTKDDLEELALVIRLPEIDPETEVTWREEETQNPQGKKLTAVLLLNDADAGKFSGSKTGEKVEIDAATWFPAELIAQAPLSGDKMLKGTSFPATDFVNAPYGKGRVIRVDNTNYFIVELTTN